MKYILFYLNFYLFACQNQPEFNEPAGKNGNHNITQDTIFDTKVFVSDIQDTFHLIKLYDINSQESLLKLVNKGKTLHTIFLPSQIDVNGFSLDKAESIRNGFELSVEYGSRFYFRKKFQFSFINERFYLTKIITHSFDQNNPNINEEESIEIIEPVQFNEFKILEFVSD